MTPAECFLELVGEAVMEHTDRYMEENPGRVRGSNHSDATVDELHNFMACLFGFSLIKYRKKREAWVWLPQWQSLFGELLHQEYCVSALKEFYPILSGSMTVIMYNAKEMKLVNFITNIGGLAEAEDSSSKQPRIAEFYNNNKGHVDM